MMKALASLKSLKLARVRRLTLAYAPDFDADISHYVSQTSSNNSSKYSSPPKGKGKVETSTNSSPALNKAKSAF